MIRIKFMNYLIPGIIPVLIVLLILPMDLAAKNSTKIKVEKQDGTLVSGTLLHVDVAGKSLVVSKNGLGIKIYTDDIILIRYKKSPVHKAGKLGFTVGGCIGFGVVAIAGLTESHNCIGTVDTLFLSSLSGLALGLIGYVLGLAHDADTNNEKTIQLKDEPPDHIEKILIELEKLT